MTLAFRRDFLIFRLTPVTQLVRRGHQESERKMKMARSNISIVRGFSANPAEMRAMEKPGDRLAWMDKRLIVKHRSGKWSEAAMRAIGQKAGIKYEMEIVIK